jgi:site-specific recombinase XerD
MIDQFYSDPLSLERLRSGPLGSHIDTFAQILSAQDYARSTAKEKIRVVAGLSGWLQRRQRGVETLDEQSISAFLRHWHRQGLCRRTTSHTLKMLLALLRDGGFTRKVASVANSAFYDVEKDFVRYLTQERGLTQATLDNHVPTARTFLSECFGKGPLALDKLDPQDITRFMIRHAHKASARLVTTALRSFFRFLTQRGDLVRDLSASVPTVATWRLSEVPKFLEPDHVERLLKACPQDTPVGQRDYAILLLLARLGLRAGEVVHLELDNIDWEKGEISVRGKSIRHDRLPIPQDVGEALAKYLRYGRPRSPSRRVFIRMNAPRQGFAGSPAICDVVRRALDRAGLSPTRKGSHLLRHGLATRMLRGGASLAEIGEILRHQRPSTTEIYAKVDVAALRALALPWKGGAR